MESAFQIVTKSNAVTMDAVPCAAYAWWAKHALRASVAKGASLIATIKFAAAMAAVAVVVTVHRAKHVVTTESVMGFNVRQTAPTLIAVPTGVAAAVARAIKVKSASKASAQNPIPNK